MTTKKTRHFAVHLAYFKQGDDFAHALKEEEGDTLQALTTHAENLEAVATHLRTLAAQLPAGISLTGDTHTIYGEGPEESLQPLVDAGLIAWSPFEEDDEDDEE